MTTLTELSQVPEHVELLIAAIAAALALRGEDDRRETKDLVHALRAIVSERDYRILGVATAAVISRQMRHELVAMGARPKTLQ